MVKKTWKSVIYFLYGVWNMFDISAKNIRQIVYTKCKQRLSEEKMFVYI